MKILKKSMKQLLRCLQKFKKKIGNYKKILRRDKNNGTLVASEKTSTRILATFSSHFTKEIVHFSFYLLLPLKKPMFVCFAEQLSDSDFWIEYARQQT